MLRALIWTPNFRKSWHHLRKPAPENVKNSLRLCLQGIQECVTEKRDEGGSWDAIPIWFLVAAVLKLQRRRLIWIGENHSDGGLFERWCHGSGRWWWRRSSNNDDNVGCCVDMPSRRWKATALWWLILILPMRRAESGVQPESGGGIYAVR